MNYIVIVTQKTKDEYGYEIIQNIEARFDDAAPALVFIDEVLTNCPDSRCQITRLNEDGSEAFTCRRF